MHPYTMMCVRNWKYLRAVEAWYGVNYGMKPHNRSHLPRLRDDSPKSGLTSIRGWSRATWHIR